MAQIDIKNCFLRVCDGRRATLSPASVPANSALTFTDADYHHGTRWQTLDPVSVSIVVAGTNTALSVVAVSTQGSKSVTINQSTNGGGAATGTANQIIAAVVASAAASALVTVANAGGSSGVGVTDAVSATPLATGPRVLTVKIGDGNLTWDETQNRVYFKDRGILDAVRNGDETPLDVKWAFAYEFLEEVVGTQASVTSSNAAPWTLTPADTLIVTFDTGGAQTFTFSATAAVKAGSAPTLPPTASNTLLVKVDGGAVQTFTFAGSENTPALVAALINNTMTGGSAVVNGSNIDLRSDSKGTGSSIQVTGGSAAAAVGQAVATASGSGNVVNIVSVKYSELTTILSGLTNGTLTQATGGYAVLTSNVTGGGSTVTITGTARTEFGFASGTTTGLTTGTPTVEDALDQRANGSTWITTSPDTCEPYCVDLELEYDAPCTPVRKEFAVYPMFRYEGLDHDPKGSQVSVNGKCNVTVATVYEF